MTEGIGRGWWAPPKGDHVGKLRLNAKGKQLFNRPNKNVAKQQNEDVVENLIEKSPKSVLHVAPHRITENQFLRAWRKVYGNLKTDHEVLRVKRIIDKATEFLEGDIEKLEYLHVDGFESLEVSTTKVKEVHFDLNTKKNSIDWNGFYVRDEYKKQGIATKYIHNFLKYLYDEQNIEEIYFNANDKDGAVVWAKMGGHFLPEYKNSYLNKFRAMSKQVLNSMSLTPEEKRQEWDKIEKISDAEELVNYTFKNRMIGAEVLHPLDSKWDGVGYLSELRKREII